MQYAFSFCSDEATNRSPTKQKDALFFAVLPSDEVRIRATHVRQRLVAEHSLQDVLLRPAPERFHISVFGVGEFGRLRREHVDAAMRAASVVVLPSFEMRLDTVASFGRARRDGRMHRRPLVLFGEAADLSELRRVLANAFKRGHAGQFAPHMTLLYSPTVIGSTRIEPFRLAVSEFVLIHSEVGLTRHHIIGRWRLAA